MPLKPLQVVDVIQRLHIDTAGPVPVSSTGMRYFFVAVDSLSGWPFAKAVPACNAFAAWEFIYEVISYVGVPESVLTDGGPEYQSVFAGNLATLGIKHMRTPPCTARVNGSAVRMVQNIKNAIRSHVDTHGAQCSA